ESHAVALGRVKRLEHEGDGTVRQAGATIAYLYERHAIALSRAKRDMTERRIGVLQRIAGVHEEIEQHLLELNSIAQNRRQIGGEIDVDGDAPADRVAFEQLHDVADRAVDFERLVPRRAALQQRPHALHDIARTLVVAANVDERIAQLVERQWR